MLERIDGQPREVPSLPLATVVVLAVVRQQLARWAG